MKHKLWLISGLVSLALAMGVMIADAQGPTRNPRAPRANAGTAFTYQGQLKNGGVAVNGTCDIIFALYDAPTAGNQIGYAVGSPNPVPVTNGLFTVQIDFGSGVIKGDAAWLLPTVRCPAGSGGWSMLDPRQPLTPAPMALALPGLYTKQTAGTPNIIGGYSGNVISDTVEGGTISGGGWSNFSPGYINRVVASFGTIGGGHGNQAGNDLGGAGFATVGGGQNNKARGPVSTISGGQSNEANEGGATVGGGVNNHALTFRSTVSGGENNTASGSYATVGGGSENIAAGHNSFVVGYRAKNSNAAHDGVFMFADSSLADLNSTAANQFLIRASGGITMYTNSAMSIGVSLNPSDSSWNVVSDRAAKENLTEVNSREILARVAALPMQTWNYKGGAIRHIGPMAQDFYAAFAVGPDDKHISTVDADGVALAAIQGLNEIVEEKDTRIATLEKQTVAQQKQIDDLTARLTALEQASGIVKSPPNDFANNSWILGALLIAAVVIGARQWRGER